MPLGKVKKVDFHIGRKAKSLLEELVKIVLPRLSSFISIPCRKVVTILRSLVGLSCNVYNRANYIVITGYYKYAVSIANISLECLQCLNHLLVAEAV